MGLPMKEKFGSFEKFNRVLYGGHTHDDKQDKYFTFAGDTPVFMGAASDFSKNTWCYQAKNGTFISGLAVTEIDPSKISQDFFSGGGAQNSGFFHNSSDCTARWHHGFMSYDLSRFSPMFPRTSVHIEVYPLQTADGFAVHYEIESEQQVIFCAGFGGITSFNGRYEYHNSAGRDYTPDDCLNNTAQIVDHGAKLCGPENVSMLIGCDFDCQYRLDAPEALCEEFPAQFLLQHPGEKKIVKLCRMLNAGEKFTGNIVIIRNDTAETLKNLLNEPDLPALLRKQIRSKFDKTSFFTPDQTLTELFPDTMIALDAAFHGKTFYHGAVGYHAPFLGWRGWYAPTLTGQFDRVKTAVNSHFDTITRAEGEEKVWYDGADRPELDHEGTQYHHLINTSGRLTALLHIDDIYDMQEVALDMTLHYLENSGDMTTAAVIYDRICEVLDWEERILDPDNDGLYQNFLNTWISDGHSYNGGGCAQASSYNYAANIRTAAIGIKLNRNTDKLIRRADKIKNAVQQILWDESDGILAEYIDTIGNKLRHTAPELSTIYLAVESGIIDRTQAYRLLKYVENNIPHITTDKRNGKLYYSSCWLPKKYSTCGIFPAENAALALAYYYTEQPEKAFEIVQGFADAFDLSPYPGSITHVLSDRGGTDDGDIDFTDASSTCLRMIIEGMWGIRINRISGNNLIVPQLPENWNEASLTLPYLSISMHRRRLCDIWQLVKQDNGEYIFKIPMNKAVIDQISVNGDDMPFEVHSSFKRTYASIRLSGTVNTVKIYYRDTDFPAIIPDKINTMPGNRHFLTIQGGYEIDRICGSNIVEHLHDGFIQIKENTLPGKYDILINCGKVMIPVGIEIPDLNTACTPIAAGKNQHRIDISGFFNAALTDVHQREYLSPRPEGYSIGVRRNGRYAWEWNHMGHNALYVDDSYLRGSRGIFNAWGNWQFDTPESGDNVCCVSIWDNFPTVTSIPLNGRANTLAVLFCGTTNAMQSKVVNAVIRVNYCDGSQEKLELINPDNFSDFLHPVYQKVIPTVETGHATHASVATIALDNSKELSDVTFEAVANEVILMVFAVTLDTAE